MIGVAKANSMVDIGKLEYCVRDDLNQQRAARARRAAPDRGRARRAAGGDEPIDAPYFPPDVGKPGSRPLPIGDRIYIDRDDWRDEPPPDYQRLAPGRTVRLRYGYCITADEVVARDADGDGHEAARDGAPRDARRQEPRRRAQGLGRDPLGRRGDERARPRSGSTSGCSRCRSPRRAAATSSSSSTRLARGRARRAASRRASRARRSARAGSSSASATSSSTRTRSRARSC